MSSTRRRSNSEGALVCGVCLEEYNEDEHRPLILPSCGHTFCKLCLIGVLTKEGIKGQLLCPTCRRHQPVQAVEDLPSNYSLLELARKDSVIYSSSSGRISNDNRDSGELCPEHGSRLAFWCTSCEVAACGECLFDGHPRPEHELAKVEDHLPKLKELMSRHSTRIITQLNDVTEENNTKVKAALIAFVELLRQKRIVDKLLGESQIVRNTAKESCDLASLSSVSETLKSIEKEFKASKIDSEVTVSLKYPFATNTSTPGKSPVTGPAKDSDAVKTEELIDFQSNLTVIPSQAQDPSLIVASFPEPIEESLPLPLSIMRTPHPSQFPPKPLVKPKPPLLAKPALVPKPKTTVVSVSASPVTTFSLTQASSGLSSAKSTSKPTVSSSSNVQNQQYTPCIEMKSVSTQTYIVKPESINSQKSEHQDSDQQSSIKNGSLTSLDSPPWPSVLCGMFSANWTSSKITLEPRGLHVYSLEPMKEKCDVFLNLKLITSLAPVESPTVFLDLQEGSRPLGRVYIKLQIRLRRAQQFFSLCMGDRGPSYKGSFFHSVIRRGDTGEGLAGGDYDGKAGKGGPAIFTGIEPNKELAKHCERGMVSRLTAKTETAAQFCITVRDGLRTKTVFPFGRVCQGINVVVEACRRPSNSISVANCGCVLLLP